MTLLTLNDACERVSRRPRTVRYWIARGWLGAVARDTESGAHLYREHDVLVAERRARTGRPTRSPRETHKKPTNRVA